jgi:DNA-binding transcriptional regulator YhcF (GntR family)
MEGWIKLHRVALEKGWLSDHKLWVVWCYCLLKASYRERKIMVNRQSITLLPGQFVFGRNQMSRELRMKPSTVYRIMKRLEDEQNIIIKSNNKFSIVTVVNWHTYQDAMTSDEHQKELPKNNKQTTTGHKQEVKHKRREYTSAFTSFWESYPRKIAKEDAFKAWQKLNPHNGLVEHILSALSSQKQTAAWTKEDRRFIPYPATWLNGRRWEDEIPDTMQSHRRLAY